MSDPILNQAAQQMADQALQQGAGDAGGVVPEQDVADADQAAFDSAMEGVEETGQSEKAGDVSGAEKTEGRDVNSSDGCSGDHETLGDAILNGLEHIKSCHEGHMNRIQAQLAESGGGSMTVQDAMRLQFEVMQMGIEQDLTTKMADKTSQGVQTLFRNQ